MTPLTRLLPLTALLLSVSIAVTVPEREQHVREVLRGMELQPTPCRAPEIGAIDLICAATTLPIPTFTARWSEFSRAADRVNLIATPAVPWALDDTNLPWGKGESSVLGVFKLPDGDMYVIRYTPGLGEAQITWTRPVAGSRFSDPGQSTLPPPTTNPLHLLSRIPGGSLPRTVNAQARATRRAPFTMQGPTAHADFHLQGPVKSMKTARRLVTTSASTTSETLYEETTRTFDRQGRLLTLEVADRGGAVIHRSTYHYTGALLTEKTTFGDDTTLRSVFDHQRGVTTRETVYETTGRMLAQVRFTPFPNGYLAATQAPDGTLVHVELVEQDERGRAVRSENIGETPWVTTAATYEGDRLVSTSRQTSYSNATVTQLPNGSREVGNLDGDPRAPVVTSFEQRDRFGNPTVTRVFKEVNEAGRVALEPDAVEYHAYEYH